jgi:hypothetical protein
LEILLPNIICPQAHNRIAGITVVLSVDEKTFDLWRTYIAWGTRGDETYNCAMDPPVIDTMILIGKLGTDW